MRGLSTVKSYRLRTSKWSWFPNPDPVGSKSVFSLTLAFVSMASPTLPGLSVYLWHSHNNTRLHINNEPILDWEGILLKPWHFI